MGKTKEQRRAAAQAFHAKAERAKPFNPFTLSDEHIRAAAQFAIDTSVEQAEQHSGLAGSVLSKIANGKFTATRDQVPAVVNAAISMGWTPPKA